jgi:hypothetical protein
MAFGSRILLRCDAAPFMRMTRASFVPLFRGLQSPRKRRGNPVSLASAAGFALIYQLSRNDGGSPSDCANPNTVAPDHLFR